MLPVPTLDDLATFSGRGVQTFSGFAPQALAQATLMFSVVTGLPSLPDDPDLAQLANNAIMEMADRLLLEQPYQAIQSGPFQSETIGSYTYSKVTATAVKVQNGVKTGLFWWDIAFDRLAVPGTSALSHGSVRVWPQGLAWCGDGWVMVDPVDGDGRPGDAPPYVRIS